MIVARRRLAAEHGMTLVEVLVTIVIGMIVMFAALSMMDLGFNSSARVQDRTDAAARGRQAFDRATSLLQAQVCNGNKPPVVAGTTTAVTFNANTGDRAATPVQYQLYYSPPAGGVPGRLVERRWQMSAAADVNGVYSPVSFTDTTIVSGVEPITVGPPASPVFRYFGTNDTTTNAPVELAAPLAAGTAAANYIGRVLRVDIDLRVLPTRTRSVAEARRLSSRIQASAYVVSNLDPTKLDKGPQCS